MHTVAGSDRCCCACMHGRCRAGRPGPVPIRRTHAARPARNAPAHRRALAACMLRVLSPPHQPASGALPRRWMAQALVRRRAGGPWPARHARRTGFRLPFLAGRDARLAVAVPRPAALWHWQSGLAGLPAVVLPRAAGRPCDIWHIAAIRTPRSPPECGEMRSIAAFAG